MTHVVSLLIPEAVSPPPSSGAQTQIRELFPHLFGQPSVQLLPQEVPSEAEGTWGPTTIGVVLSGGQAPGGHNVIAGLFGEFQQVQHSTVLHTRAQ